ncbi:MAG: transposase [Planctomycetota bacterium]
MARISRVVVPGHPHHVTQRGVRSLPIFTGPEDQELYLRHLQEQGARAGLEFLGWCLMPNHVHLIVVPEDEMSLARGVGEAHRRYTRDINVRTGCRGYLFQGRFGSCVLDKRHLVAAGRYVDMNPVRAGLAAHPEDYAWSSARFHCGRAQTDPLVRDRMLMGLVEDWPALLARTDGEGEAWIRRKTRTGRPAGDGAFVKKMERKTGRILRPGKPGPKVRRSR